MYDDLEDVMRDPEATLNLVSRLVEDDDIANRQRAKTKGLIDGNAPYNPQKLVKAGRAEACNVNWRIAEAYTNSSLTAYYDLMAEAPTFAEGECDWGTPQQAHEWSKIITAEFDRLQRRYESGWDHCLQVSQFNMVVFGTGPMMGDHPLDWRLLSFPSGDLKVPRRTESTTDKWEVAAVLQTYMPHDLWRNIENTAAATQVGWKVDAVKQSIINAHPASVEDQYRRWEWHQQELKANSYSYSYRSKAIEAARVYMREKPQEGEDEGRISVAIIPLMGQTSDQGNVEFLFKKRGLHRNWRQAIHPFYFDQGTGFHHAVTGLATKMYSSLEYQNRLYCNLADKAFSPKILFQPTTASESEKLQIATFGDYGILPPGLEVHQAMIQGMLEDGMAFNRELTGLLASNLSMYRQNLQKESGNPITATEMQYRAGEQARLSTTQLNRYYEQLDWMFQEKYRRAVNPHVTQHVPGGKHAMDFQRRCEIAGVPREALRRFHVRATRIVGNGSVFVRQQSLEFLLGILAMLPESGRAALIRDVIAARAGRVMVNRYYPDPVTTPDVQDQTAQAMLENAALVQGAPLIVTDTQNHAIHSATHIGAMESAVQSIEMGAQPGDVLTLLQAGLQHTGQHVEAMANDPSRKALVQQFSNQLKVLSQTAGQIQSALQQQAAEAQQQQMQQQAAMDDAQLKQMKLDNDMRNKNAKTEFQIQDKARKSDFDIALKARNAAVDTALKDARTAADIALSTQKARTSNNGPSDD